MPRNERLRQHRIARNWRQQEVADQLMVSLVSVQRWERGIQQPSAYYRARLCTLFGLSSQELGLLDEPSQPEPSEREATNAVHSDTTASDEHEEFSISQRKQPWNVPFARNSFFTGRSVLLERLHKQLFRRKRAALSGLGGIGKTQIAIEFAYRFREAYRAVFWVRAASRETLTADYVAIAHLLGVPGHDAQKQMQVVATVKRWLDEQQDWLLILDNADDLSLLSDFLPLEDRGHLLLTTRAQAIGTIARGLHVEKMEVSEGIRFVLYRAKLLEEDEPLETVSATTRTAAQRLVEELDGLPLALDQAGAYIEETGCSLSQYLGLYMQHRLTLLKRKSDLTSDYPHTVDSTWTLAFAQVERANVAAADLMRVCAFLHPDAIPEEILTEGAAELGPHLENVATEPLLLNDLFQPLRRYSLVKRDAEARLLNLHRLVQVVLKEHLDTSLQRQWAERVVFAINATFPTVEQSTWPRCERLLSQALASAQLMEQYQIVHEKAGRLLHETATYLYEHARYEEAEPLYQQALHIREQSLGPMHPDVAATLDGLAILYRTWGRYLEAEPLFLRSLAINEQQSGPEHPDTAQSLNNLAILYYDQGKDEQAEAFYQRALAINEKALGRDHPATARILNNLAVFYAGKKMFAEAEPFFQQVVHIMEQQLGPEHPRTITGLNNLAELYREEGKYEEAESLYRRALLIWETTLGADHPRVALGLTGIAILYQEQGRYAESEQIFQQALHIQEQRLGLESHQVASTLKYLAALYTGQGKYSEAEPLYYRALHIREKQLGEEHYLVAEALHRLANLYHAQGLYEQAEPLYLRTLVINEQQSEKKNANIVETLYDFARLKEAQGNYEEARLLYTRAFTIREQVPGTAHPETEEIRMHLIALLRTIGQHEDAHQPEITGNESKIREEGQKAHLAE